MTLPRFRSLRHCAGLALLALCGIAMAQGEVAPTNDLPNPYKSVALDPQGRLFVADRGNMRIQIMDQEGDYLAESNGVAPHPGWLRGISVAEGVAVDAKDNAYGGEVGPRQLVRHARP